MIRTHTKTFTLYDAWASTIPWNCLVRETNCCHPTHDHDTMVGQICAEPQCDQPLREGEECYYVTQLPAVDGREQAVCWRHVRPDQGPVTA